MAGRLSWLLAPLLLVSACVDDGVTHDFDDGLEGDGLVQRYCAVVSSCQCPDELLGTPEGCEAQTGVVVATFRATAAQAGLTRDGSCEETLLEDIEQRGCGWSHPGHSSCGFCRLYHGDRQRAESCTTYRRSDDEVEEGLTRRGLDDCDVGLVCHSGFCDDPCAGSSGDEAPPLLADGQACTGHAECQSFYCPVGYCFPRPEVGELCPQNICAEGAECSSGRCELDSQPSGLAACISPFP